MIVKRSTLPNAASGANLLIEVQQQTGGKYLQYKLLATFEEVERRALDETQSMYDLVQAITTFDVIPPVIVRNLMLPIIELPEGASVISQTMAFANYAELDGDYGAVVLDVSFFANNKELIFTDTLDGDLTVTTLYYGVQSSQTATAYSYVTGELELTGVTLEANHQYKITTFNSNLSSIQDVWLNPSNDLTHLVVPVEYNIPFETSETLELQIGVQGEETQIDVFTDVAIEDETLNFKGSIVFDSELLEVGQAYRVNGTTHFFDEWVFLAISTTTLEVDYEKYTSDIDTQLFDDFLPTSDVTVLENCNLELFNPKLKSLPSALEFYKQS